MIYALCLLLFFAVLAVGLHVFSLQAELEETHELLQSIRRENDLLRWTGAASHRRLRALGLIEGART